MSTTEVQIWVGILGTFTTIVVSLLGVLGFQRRRDKSAAVGSAFREVIDALASESQTRQMAAAILIRRFFDVRSEQGRAGAPYAKESVAVIAGLLRQAGEGEVQKTLADGLRFARSLAGADLQRCNLTKAFLGIKEGDPKVPNLTHADLFEANLAGASLRGVYAKGAVFYRAILVETVFRDAVLDNADFRCATLTRADFTGATFKGARFADALDVPQYIKQQLDEGGTVPQR